MDDFTSCLGDTMSESDILLPLAFTLSFLKGGHTGCFSALCFSSNLCVQSYGACGDSSFGSSSSKSSSLPSSSFAPVVSSSSSLSSLHFFPLLIPITCSACIKYVTFIYQVYFSVQYGKAAEGELNIILGGWT
jgi:hypothetical protein